MRVLMLSTNSSLLDGINRHILSIAPVINRQRGYEVAVCTVMPPGEFQQALTEAGVKCFSLGFTNGHDWRIIKAYTKVLNEFQPDIIHVHVMALMERIVSSFTHKNIRYVQTVHGVSDPVKPLSLKGIKSFIEKLLCKISPIRLKAILYISQGVMNTVRHNNKIHIIKDVCYNPIDFNVCKNHGILYKKLNLSADTIVIGTACRIADVKAPEVFTKVMCNVLRQREYVHAVVMGDGDKDIITKCKGIVEESGVKNRFHWLGYCKDASLLIQDLSCFVLTSKREGMPTSVIECFAAHTPVAMLQGEGGLKDLEMLNREFGPILTIADRNNPSELADKIAGIIGSPDKAISIAGNAFKVGRRHFDIDAVAEQLCRIYTEITG